MTRYRPLAIVIAVLLVGVLVTSLVLIAVQQATMPAVARAQQEGVPASVDGDGVIDEWDGEITDAIPVDAARPALQNLNPDLRAALEEAASAAEADGIAMLVQSGWRSAEYQEQLLQEAVSEYGSREEAARWVATPQTSAHVRGEAVDVGPTDAYYWMAQYGADFGLCQVYANEPWHYELAEVDADGYCPMPYDDPTKDPRMQP